jgi:hypothetical protein
MDQSDPASNKAHRRNRDTGLYCDLGVRNHGSQLVERENMKYILTPIIALALLLNGCSAINDAAITAGVTALTKAGLESITPSAKQTAIANFVDALAVPLRALTGNETPAQLTALLLAEIPQNFQTQYPELVNWAVPLIVGEYTTLYNQYHGNVAHVYQVANDIAVGLVAGASQYISPNPSPTP